MKTPAQLLREFRERQNPPLSYEKFGQLIPVDRSTAFRWENENDPRQIDEDLLPRVSEVTGISPELLRPDIFEKYQKIFGVVS